MGNEIGQLREWDEKREQDWDILKYPTHDSFSRYIRDLCHIYQNNSALFECDYEKDGFRWIDCHQEEKCVYVFERKSNQQRILIFLNFSDKKQIYKFEATDVNSLELMIASDNEIYGGSEKYDKEKRVLLSDNEIEIKISSFTGLMYEVV